MIAATISPKIVLAQLKRRTALCQRHAMALTVLNQKYDAQTLTPKYLEQFKDAAGDLSDAANMEYEFETLMMLANCCSDPGPRRAYAAILAAASERVLKALVDGETFKFLGIPADAARGVLR